MFIHAFMYLITSCHPIWIFLLEFYQGKTQIEVLELNSENTMWKGTWQLRKRLHLFHNHKLYDNYLMPVLFQQHLESLWKQAYVALSPATHKTQTNTNKTKGSRHLYFDLQTATWVPWEHLRNVYLQNSRLMPTINNPIHVRVTDKEANNSIWNDRCHFKQKFAIIFLHTRVTSQIIFCAHRKLVAKNYKEVEDRLYNCICIFFCWK